MSIPDLSKLSVTRGNLNLFKSIQIILGLSPRTIAAAGLKRQHTSVQTQKGQAMPSYHMALKADQITPEEFFVLGKQIGFKDPQLLASIDDKEKKIISGGKKVLFGLS